TCPNGDDGLFWGHSASGCADGNWGGCGPSFLGWMPPPGWTAKTFPAHPKPIISVAKRLACAAQYGNQHSLSGFLGIQHNWLGNGLLGNTVSGLVELGLSVFSNASVPNWAQAAFTSVGLPTRSAGLKGASGIAQETAAKAFYNGVTGANSELVTGITGAAATPATVPGYELSVTGATADLGAEVGSGAAESFATGIGVTKFFYDLASFGYGYAIACAP
ncbi:MAG: hypothetical protein ACRD22_19630, partial [Terriglobia bacterium]